VFKDVSIITASNVTAITTRILVKQQKMGKILIAVVELYFV